jgi:hypothetical protein
MINQENICGVGSVTKKNEMEKKPVVETIKLRSLQVMQLDRRKGKGKTQFDHLQCSHTSIASTDKPPPTSRT